MKRSCSDERTLNRLVASKGDQRKSSVISQQAVGSREMQGVPVRCGLTTRWSGRVQDKVPSSCDGVRAAQLNR
jgi:hypothetical protein